MQLAVVASQILVDRVGRSIAAGVDIQVVGVDNIQAVEVDSRPVATVDSDHTLAVLVGIDPAPVVAALLQSFVVAVDCCCCYHRSSISCRGHNIQNKGPFGKDIP